MESKRLTVEHDLSETGAEIFHEYFVAKSDMSRAGMFDRIQDEYDSNTGTMTLEGEVKPAVSDQARKAVEDALAFAEYVGRAS